METRRLGTRGGSDTPAPDGRDDTVLFEVILKDRLLIVCRGAALRLWLEQGGDGLDIATYFQRAARKERK